MSFKGQSFTTSGAPFEIKQEGKVVCVHVNGWVENKQLKFACPFCVKSYNKKGVPRANAKPVIHCHGAGYSVYNEYESRAPHCAGHQYDKNHFKNITGFEFIIKLPDNLVNSPENKMAYLACVDKDYKALYNEYKLIMDKATTKKLCRSCLELKPIDEFNKQSTGKYGVKSMCKPCEKEKNYLNYTNRKHSN